MQRVGPIALAAFVAVAAWITLVDRTREEPTELSWPSGQALPSDLRDDLLANAPAELPYSDLRVDYAAAWLRLDRPDGQAILNVGGDEDAAWASVGEARWVIAYALLARLRQLAQGHASQEPTSLAPTQNGEMTGARSVVDGLQAGDEPEDHESHSSFPAEPVHPTDAWLAAQAAKEASDLAITLELPRHWTLRQTVDGQYTAERVAGRGGGWAVRLRNAVDKPEGEAVLIQTVDVSDWTAPQLDARWWLRGALARQAAGGPWHVEYAGTRRLEWHSVPGYGTRDALTTDWSVHPVTSASAVLQGRRLELGVVLAGQGFIDMDDVQLVPHEPALRPGERPTPNAVLNPGFEHWTGQGAQGDQ